MKHCIGNVNLPNERMRLFCIEYAVDGNGTQAVIRAGYKGKPDVRAVQLLSHPQVQKAVALLRKEQEKLAKVSKEQLLNEISATVTRDSKALFTKEGILVLNHSLLKKKGSRVCTQGDTVHDLPPEITRSVDGIKQKCREFQGEDYQRIDVQTELKLVGKASAWDMLMKHYGAYAPEKVQQMNVNAQLPDDWFSPHEGIEDEVQKILEDDT